MINVPWIVKNMMIGDSGETTKLRRLSEIEMKVQKSLQKLTIPDWYVNKRRESPKIISDRRPIEIRPAPWKESNYRNHSPLSKNHRYEATEKKEIAKPIFGNDERSLKLFSDEPKLVKKSQKKLLKRDFEISKTFPKISPSRKIQNINIVFSATNASQVSKFSDKSLIIDSAVEEKILKKTTTTKIASTPKKENKNQNLNEDDYLNEFLPQKMSTFENDEISNKNLDTSFDKPTARILTYDDSPKRYGKNNYLHSCDNDDDIEMEDRKNLENFDENNYRNKIFDGKINFFESKKFNDQEKTATKLLSRNFSTKSSKNASFEKSLRQNFEEEEEKEKYDDVELFKTPKKSTEMENIIKKSNNQRKRSSGKSFVEEIIEELNSKCSPKVKTNRDVTSSPGTKNFVKKLVRELEMGFFTENKDNDIDDDNDDDGKKNELVILRDETLSTDTENNSSVVIRESKFMSKSNENEFCDIREKSLSLRSSLCNSPFGNFSRALEYRSEIKSRESVTAYVDDDDESVFWIPLPRCRLPRTSSLKNVTSTNLVTEISEPSAKSGSSLLSGWGKTFDKGQSRRSRALFRIDETTVGDSGYSDRSETNSSSSSIVGEESWYSESETTRTASEDSDNGSDNYSDNFGKADFYRSKQRTSVV